MYIPHTDNERQKMLQRIGIAAVEDLFKDIPAEYRFPDLDLPDGLSEMEALEQFKLMSEANNTTGDLLSFLGAGAYDHYSPSAVDMLLRRGDFFTAYTPYQPEISQGTLQAIFEFQSLIANLTGMEISNASHYDGATAAAEAVISAYFHFRKKRKKIIISPFIHPDYAAVITTYLQAHENIEIIIPEIDTPEQFFKVIPDLVDDKTAMVMFQYPDFLGNIFDYTKLIKDAHALGALTAAIVYPISLGLVKSPAEMDVDFVVGEGQSLGLPLNFGGPYIGFFTTKKEFVRKVSGRIVGETVDQDGNRGYVLTLTAREQHIRREKSTSNICTNQGLNALAVAIYLSLLGKHGLRDIANQCYQKAHYLAEKISIMDEYKLVNTAPFFNEFTIECSGDPERIADYLLDIGILPGLQLGQYFPGRKNQLLIAVTEKIKKEELDYFAETLVEAAHV